MNLKGCADYWRQHRGLLAILALGLAARLAVLFLYLGMHDWQGETWEYEMIARNILEGRGFTLLHNNTIYSSFIVPVFPLICAFLHLIGGPGLGLYYVFHLSIAVGVIWLTYAVAHRWYSARTAVLAAMLVALEPGLLVYHSYKVDVIALSTFLLLLGIYWLLLLGRAQDRRLAVLVGAIAGIGVLTRPDLAGFLAAPIVWAVIQRRQYPGAGRTAVVVLLVAFAVMTPWIVRNSYIHGRLVTLVTISGESLWRGNNPNATGTTVTSDIRGQLEAAPEEFRRKVYSLGEVEQNAFFRQEALRYIAMDPLGFFVRAIQKLYYFWWFTPTSFRQYYEWIPSPFVAAYPVLYGTLLIFALLGGWYAMRGPVHDTRWVTLCLLTAPMAIAVIHSINYVEGRHRVLVMPVVLLLSAHGMVGLWTSRSPGLGSNGS
jgi:4-amino-4-deoxy-L-arabinose transferase-like glycosyltransferase